jgi:hypothetical protein
VDFFGGLAVSGDGKKGGLSWTSAHRTIHILVRLVVTERGTSDSQAIQHPQDAGASGNLVEAFDAQKADQLAGSERREDLGRVRHEAEYLGVPIEDAVKHVDLLERGQED